MKKLFKKMSVIICVILIFSTVNCFAATHSVSGLNDSSISINYSMGIDFNGKTLPNGHYGENPISGWVKINSKDPLVIVKSIYIHVASCGDYYVDGLGSRKVQTLYNNSTTTSYPSVGTKYSVAFNAGTKYFDTSGITNTGVHVDIKIVLQRGTSTWTADLPQDYITDGGALDLGWF